MVAVARIEGMKYACVRLEPDGDNAVNPIIKWICQLLRPASNVPIQAHLALSQFGPTVSAWYWPFGSTDVLLAVPR